MATVLYVDDEAAIRRAVRSWLTRKGHVVHVAADLAAARAAIVAHPLDGIFIDLWIGTESGLELLSWVDELDPELARRVAFVTGDIFGGENTTLAQRFGHPIFPKPFQLRDLEEQAAGWARDHARGPGIAPRRVRGEGENGDGDAELTIG